MSTPGTNEKPSARTQSDFDQVMEHVQAIRDDFAALAAATGKLAANTAKDQKAKVRHLASEASDKAETYRDVVVERVREHPLAAIGIAALAGLVVSSLRKR